MTNPSKKKSVSSKPVSAHHTDPENLETQETIADDVLVCDISGVRSSISRKIVCRIVLQVICKTSFTSTQYPVEYLACFGSNAIAADSWHGHVQEQHGGSEC